MPRVREHNIQGSKMDNKLNGLWDYIHRLKKVALAPSLLSPSLHPIFAIEDTYVRREAEWADFWKSTSNFQSWWQGKAGRTRSTTKYRTEYCYAYSTSGCSVEAPREVSHFQERWNPSSLARLALPAGKHSSCSGTGFLQIRLQSLQVGKDRDVTSCS